MSKKSQNRGAIKEIYNNVFVGENSPEYRSGEVTYVIEDGMIQLQSFSHSDKVPTGREMLRYMLNNVMNYFDRTACKAYVFILDKIDFVYMIKGIEHKKRAKSKNVIPAPDPQPDEDLLPMDKPIPYNWGSMMANRKARKHLINQIAKAIVECYYPPAGKMLIIDGGLSDDPSQPVAIYSGVESSDVVNYTRSVLLGDRWKGSDNGLLSEKSVTRPSNFKNKVGECDECALFYLKYFLDDRSAFRKGENIPADKDPVQIDVITGDTDFIPINLSFYHPFVEENIDIRVVFPLRESEREAMGAVKDVFIVRTMYRRLWNDFSAVMKRPDLCMTAAMILSGNDYVDGYKGIVPSVVLSTFTKRAAFIGDLVTVKDENWQVDHMSYLRFIRAVLGTKYSKKITKHITTLIKRSTPKLTKSGKPSKRKPPVFCEEDIKILEFLSKTKPLPDVSDLWQTLPWSMLKYIVSTGKKGAVIDRVPSNVLMWLRYKRLCLNLIMIKDGCKGGPEIIESVCLDYGYSLIDNTRKLSAYNVRQTEDTDSGIMLPSDFLLALST